jgi:hypothetical protein
MAFFTLAMRAANGFIKSREGTWDNVQYTASVQELDSGIIG